MRRHETTWDDMRRHLSLRETTSVRWDDICPCVRRHLSGETTSVRWDDICRLTKKYYIDMRVHLSVCETTSVRVWDDICLCETTSVCVRRHETTFVLAWDDICPVRRHLSVRETTSVRVIVQYKSFIRYVKFLGKILFFDKSSGAPEFVLMSTWTRIRCVGLAWVVPLPVTRTDWQYDAMSENSFYPWSWQW